MKKTKKRSARRKRRKTLTVPVLMNPAASAPIYRHGIHHANQEDLSEYFLRVMEKHHGPDALSVYVGMDDDYFEEP